MTPSSRADGGQEVVPSQMDLLQYALNCNTLPGTSVMCFRTFQGVHPQVHSFSLAEARQSPHQVLSFSIASCAWPVPMHVSVVQERKKPQAGVLRARLSKAGRSISGIQQSSVSNPADQKQPGVHSLWTCFTMSGAPSPLHGDGCI